jgi:uracil phosphoribosyltransferase
MPLTIVDHPLAKDCIAKLRDINTNHSEYNTISKTLAILVAISATQHLSTITQNVQTPICLTTGNFIANPLVLVPILRAGLSMLNPIHELFPQAKAGFIGLQRTQSEPEQYYINVPKDPKATVLVLDPMIATGGSACTAIQYLQNMEFTDIRLVSFVAAPEGINMLETKFPHIPVYTAALDEKLNSDFYIIPGLGDFGDRLFGTVHLKT